MSESCGLRDAVTSAVDERAGPTAVVLAVAGAGPAASYAAGRTSLGGAPAGPGTRFDLASVTKVATTLAVMRLRREIDLDRPVRAVLPAFAGGSRDSVTARDLLLHRAGLWEWWPLYADASDGPAVLGDPDAAVARAAALPLRYRPGSGRHYSDLGFQLLGAIVAAVHGTDLRTAVASLVTGPLGLRGYGPDVAATSYGDSWERRMIATGTPYPVSVHGVPASRRHWLVGEANDGNAHHAFGGFAGHAGLFATAEETAGLGAVMLGGHPLWPSSVVEEFAAPGPDPEQALGWRRWEVRAPGGPVTVLGHPGFTGTEVAVAPSLGRCWALLTNRLHPTSSPVDVTALRARVARLVARL
ncbi:serine hydrolase domain-containing protein [Actinomadura sp. DC4]|uniref:serine hydrolase domain-containing protein n=1 Tax=Actinomadura sp. DC4 TaxID=3055069 RepID=UPI0025B1DBD0|nr:serine hydrolase domain-containing protein [Actinomadura sp. DC4]MDN3351277.1 serine hydrolase domain-containing protein [Actinomadura sp. DC4]